MLQMCIRRISSIPVLKFKCKVLRDNNKTYRFKLSKVLSLETAIISVIETIWQFQTALMSLQDVWCDSLYYVPGVYNDGIF